MAKARTVAHHVGDVKRTLRGYSNNRLKAYIGTRVIAILEADDQLFKQANVRALSPGLRAALLPLRPLGIAMPESDGLPEETVQRIQTRMIREGYEGL